MVGNLAMCILRRLRETGRRKFVDTNKAGLQRRPRDLIVRSQEVTSTSANQTMFSEKNFKRHP